jgi:hypothetical protein
VKEPLVKVTGIATVQVAVLVAPLADGVNVSGIVSLHAKLLLTLKEIVPPGAVGVVPAEY